MLFASKKFIIPLGTWFGIPVRLHLFFLVFLAFQSLSYITVGVEHVIFWAIALGPFLLITILLHELSHCFAAMKLGSEVHSILLWPLGGLAFIGHSSTEKADFLIALAGPISHIPQIILWILLLFAFDDGKVDLTWSQKRIEDEFGLSLLAFLVIMNITLMIFNLFIPAYPLDGGRLVVDSLLICGVSEELTAKVIIGLTVPMGVGLLIWGIVVFLPVTILIGIWILYSAWTVFSALQNGTILEHSLFRFTDDDVESGFGQDSNAVSL